MLAGRIASCKNKECSFPPFMLDFKCEDRPIESIQMHTSTFVLQEEDMGCHA
jgi:hypothetical protein